MEVRLPAFESVGTAELDVLFLPFFVNWAVQPGVRGVGGARGGGLVFVCDFGSDLSAEVDCGFG